MTERTTLRYPVVGLSDDAQAVMLGQAQAFNLRGGNSRSCHSERRKKTRAQLAIVTGR